MRLFIGFPIFLLLFVAMIYAIITSTDKTLLILFLGLFFMTLFTILFSLYAIAREN